MEIMGANIEERERLAELFTAALTEIVAKVSGFTLEAAPSQPDGGLDDIAGVIHLNALEGGSTVIISSNEDSLRVLCSYIMGLPQADVSRGDMGDALCEIGNIFAGNIKLIIGGTNILMPSTPYALYGKGMSVITKRRVAVISRTLANEAVSIKLKVIIGG